MPLGLILVIRFGLASLAFLLLGKLSFKPRFGFKEWGLIFFSGIINFSGSPFFQLSALRLTQATDVSILVSFEPLLTALLAVLFLKERLRPSTLYTFLAATLGVVIMGWQGGNADFQWQRLLGDSLFLLALLCEGTCSTVGRHLTQKYNPFELIAWMVFAGFLSNLAFNWPLLTIQNISHIPLKGWLLAGYLALACTLIGYAGWFYLLKRIEVGKLALSLFFQPLAGVFLACLLLGEKLDLQTALGGTIVLLSLLIWVKLTMPPDKKDDTAEENKIDEAEYLEDQVDAK